MPSEITRSFTLTRDDVVPPERPGPTEEEIATRSAEVLRERFRAGCKTAMDELALDLRGVGLAAGDSVDVTVSVVLTRAEEVAGRP